MAGAAAARERFAALLRGEAVEWSALQLSPSQLVDEAVRHGVVGLLRRHFDQIRNHDWPRDAIDALTRAARHLAAEELLRQREIRRTLDALTAAGVEPILFKGAAVAYAVYGEPAERPRLDTDLLVRQDQIEAARRALLASGYDSPLQCDGDLLFRQFSVSRTDEFGVKHAVDVHWRISTQTMFAEVITYDEMAADAIEVVALGAHARVAGSVHALLLACIHPSMHHRNDDWLPWMCDIAVLSQRLTGREWDRLAGLAMRKRVAAIVGHELARARQRVGARVPDQVIERLSSIGDEPSAEYLREKRRWHHELVANVRGLATWEHRRKLLSNVLLPGRAYMLARYGVPEGAVGSVLLPALYVHRGVSGLLKIATGRK